MLAGYLLIGALFGFLGYREAGNFERKYGRSPWGLSPAAWGAIVFFAGLFIGGVLLVIARRNTKRSLERGQTFTQQQAPAGAHPTFAPMSSDPANPYAAPAATAPRAHPGSMDILPS